MDYDVVIIGSGFGSLTAAALLAKRGLKVGVLEQAKYPGGCSSSFKRKGYWFETGATTLVGLDEHMPVRYLLDETKVEVPLLKLEPPMQVHLPNGETVTRYGNLKDWITEAERVFGRHNQRPFWEHCFEISQQVWRTSLQQRSFPFSNLKDVLLSAARARLSQVKLLPGAFRTMEDMLRRYDLLQDRLFVDFVNEQLLITAQNTLEEVNELFGATALCYTLFSNYYVPGGLINLVKPLVSYISGQGSAVLYRQQVQQVVEEKGSYTILTKKGSFKSRFVISGIPLNNTLELFKDEKVRQMLQPYLMPSERLNGAFTMGLVLEGRCASDVLHHQVHVPEGIPLIGSKSIFISFSHPEDKQRAPAGEVVASISTHVQHPEERLIQEKEVIETAIIEALVGKGLFRREDVIYDHSATPGAWVF